MTILNALMLTPKQAMFMLNLAVAVTLLASVGLITTLILRNRSAPLRHGMLLVTLAAMLFSPLIVLLATQSGLGVAQVALLKTTGQGSPTTEVAPAAIPIPEPLPPGGGLTATVDNYAALPAGTFSNPPSAQQAALQADAKTLSQPPKVVVHQASPATVGNPPPAIVWWQIAVSFSATVWLIGSAFAAVQLGRGCLLVMRLRRDSVLADRPCLQAEAERAARHWRLRRIPPILHSPIVPAPLSIGLIHPVIVLPARLERELASHQVRGIMVHEMAHIARHDHWVALAQRVAGTLFWWNVFVHFINHRLAALREEICDDYVMSTCGGRQFAHVLVEMAARTLRGPVLPAAVAIVEGRGSGLDHRVARLLDDDRILVTRLSAPTRVIVGAFAAASCAMLLVANIRADWRAHANDEGPIVTTEADVTTFDAEAPVAPDALETHQQEDSSRADAAIRELSNSLALEQETTRQVASRSDRYGDPIPEGALARIGTVRLRHTSALTGVAFSPDGQILASCGWDRPIRFWDVATGKPVKQLTGTIDRGTFAVAFSPDGTRLGSVGEAGLVRLWDVKSGNEIWKAEKHGGRVHGVAFAPDGHTFASAGSDGTIRVWDVATGEELLVLSQPNRVRDSHAVAYSPNGSLLACAASNDIHLFDLDTGERRTISGAHGGQMFSLAFTPDGKHLVSAGQSAYETKVNDQGERIAYCYAETRLWSVAEGALVREFGDREEGLLSSTIALSKDGRLLASLHRDRIRVWDLETGELLRTLSDYYNSFGPRTHGIAVSPDGKSVAAIGPRHAVMMWDLETGKRKLPFPEAHEGRVDCIAVSPNSPLVVTGATDGSVRIWDSETTQLVRVLHLGDKEPRAVHAVAFSPDGARLAAGGYDWKDRGSTGIVQVWKVDGGESHWSKRVAGRVTSLSYSTDGKRLAAAAGLGNEFAVPEDGLSAPTVFVWTADSGRDERSWQGPKSRVMAMRLSPNGSEVMVVEEWKVVSTWSVDNQEKVREFPAGAHARSINSAAFSPDGITVVTGGLFGELVVSWNTETGAQKRRIEVENSKGSVVAVSPDGTLLASGSIGLFSTAANRYDTDIHLWDASTGEHLGQRATGGDNVTALAFSPDGRRLLSGMNDGTLLVWDVQAAIK